MGTEGEREGRKLRFHVVTYNVAEKKKPEGDITPILGLDDKPDLISIGLEESGDFDILPDEEGAHQDPWCENINSILREHGYYLVDLTSVFQIKLRVYILKEHMKAVSHVEAVTAMSGFVGGVSNIFKGAATIRFRLYGKHVAIINCHLTAFDKRTLDRNTEYWQFFADQEFEDPNCEELYHHDYILWSGDLNYRVEFDNTQTRQMVADGKHLELLQYDQLKSQQAQGLAFVGFEEGDITFPPSYKFDMGTDIYDTSKKQRVPSWCDRVLYRVKTEREISANTVDWAPTLSELSDSDSVSSELSERSLLQVAAPEAPKEKSRLFKHKVMRKEDSTLRVEEMRRKTLGVLRKMSLSTSAGLLNNIGGPTNSPDKIELLPGDVNDAAQFQTLLAKIEGETKKARPTSAGQAIHVLSYRSYPEIKLSDHKPVSATLSVVFPQSNQGVLDIGMAPVSAQWTKGKSMKIMIKFKGLRKSLPYKSGHWVGLFKKDWVNKASYFTYSYVKKKGKPKREYDMKAKFGGSHHPKVGDVIHAVYFVSKDASEPAAFIEVKCV